METTAVVDQASMLPSTMIGLAMLGGVFLVLLVSIIKEGVAGGERAWHMMGAITGVAFGTMTTYFFTDAEHNKQANLVAELHQKQIVGYQSTNTQLAQEVRDLNTNITVLDKGYETQVAALTEQRDADEASLISTSLQVVLDSNKEAGNTLASLKTTVSSQTLAIQQAAWNFQAVQTTAATMNAVARNDVEGLSNAALNQNAGLSVFTWPYDIDTGRTEENFFLRGNDGSPLPFTKTFNLQLED